MPGTTTYLGIVYPSSSDTISADVMQSFGTAIDYKAFKEPGTKLTAKGDIITRGGTASVGGATFGNTVTKLAVGSNGQYLQFGADVPSWTNAPNSDSALTFIAATKLGTATGTVTLSSIPGTFTHLVARVTAKTNFGTISDMLMRFNSDSGTVYDYNIVNAVAGTGAAASSAISQTSAIVAALPGTYTSPYNSTHEQIFSSTDITIFNYASTSANRYGVAEAINPVGQRVLNRVTRMVGGTTQGGTVTALRLNPGMAYIGTFNAHVVSLATATSAASTAIGLGTAYTMKQTLEFATGVNRIVTATGADTLTVRMNYNPALLNGDQFVISGYTGASPLPAQANVNGTWTIDTISTPTTGTANSPTVITVQLANNAVAYSGTIDSASTALNNVSFYSTQVANYINGGTTFSGTSSVSSFSLFFGGTPARQIASHGFAYKSTGTAVNSISFIASGSFDVGSVFTLYGVK